MDTTLYAIPLWPSPSAEDALQVGRVSSFAIRAEAARYCALLLRYCGPLMAQLGDSFALRVATHPHEFGAYVEVEAVVDGEDRRAVSLAAYLETDAPATWAELESAEPISEVPVAELASHLGE